MSVALCWWTLLDVDRQDLLDAVRSADPGPVAAAAAGYLVAFYTIEVVGSLLAYRCHLGAAVPAHHATVLAGGRHLLGAVSPQLVRGVTSAYFRRRWRVPEPRVDEATELVGFADGLATVALALAAVAAGAEQVPGGLVGVLGVWGGLLALDVAWAWGPWSRSPSRLHEVTVLRALARARRRHLVALAGLRTILGLAAAGAVSGMLAAVGHELPLGQVVLLAALLANATLLPLSVAGLGGPQLVALLLPVEAWDVPAADALALSFLWSATFLLGRLVVGGALAPSLRWLLRPGAHVVRSRARDEGGRGRPRHPDRPARAPDLRASGARPVPVIGVRSQAAGTGPPGRRPPATLTRGAPPGRAAPATPTGGDHPGRADPATRAGGDDPDRAAPATFSPC